MSEDIASRDYEAEIYLLKAEIKRLGEFEDYYIRTHKHVYVAAIVQPYEEKIKRLEAEVANKDLHITELKERNKGDGR